MLNDLLNSTQSQSPTHELQALQAVAQVLDLLSDPAAATARIKSLIDAATEHRTVLDAAQTESAELDKKRQAHLELMTAERADHDAALKSARLAFENEAAATRNKLAEAQNAAAAAQAEATAARERSVVINNELQSRLEILHTAATVPLPARH